MHKYKTGSAEVRFLLLQALIKWTELNTELAKIKEFHATSSV